MSKGQDLAAAGLRLAQADGQRLAEVDAGLRQEEGRRREVPEPGADVLGFPVHPLARLFPMMDERALEDLQADMAQHGQREPIWLLDGQVLDGRNRLLCARRLGLAPVVKTFEGADPAAFIISLNLRRRHLTESQRAMVASRLAQMPAHRPKGEAGGSTLSQAQAAQLLQVSRSAVQQARKVATEGAPALVEAVEAGVVPVSVAAAVVKEAPEVQADLVARGAPAMRRRARATRPLEPGAVDALAEAVDRLTAAARVFLFAHERAAGDPAQVEAVALVEAAQQVLQDGPAVVRALRKVEA